jgi:hypothetical protein
MFESFVILEFCEPQDMNVLYLESLEYLGDAALSHRNSVEPSYWRSSYLTKLVKQNGGIMFALLVVAPFVVLLILFLIALFRVNELTSQQ